MTNDPIADMLTRIRNAVMRRNKTASIPATRVVEELAGILKQEDKIEKFEKITAKKGEEIVITLKYDEFGESVITHLERISKPGVRRYVGYKDMKPVLNNLGIGIVSTSKGIMTVKQAITEKVGGEYLCEIW